MTPAMDAAPLPGRTVEISREHAEAALHHLGRLAPHVTRADPATGTATVPEAWLGAMIALCDAVEHPVPDDLRAASSRQPTL